MTEFACIGGACEDNCCHTWSVPVTQSRLAQIRKTLRKAPADLARFEAGVELLPVPSRTRERFASLALKPDRTCSMLDTDGLCSLQRGHGPAAMPDICVTFPRHLVDTRLRLELSGSLSCPEVVRLALLREGATELVDVPRGQLAMEAEWSVDGDTPLPVLQGTDRLRTSMHRLLGRTDYPFPARLYFLLEIVNQLDAHPIDSAAAAQVLDAFDDPEVLGQLLGEVEGLLPQMAVNLIPMLSIVNSLGDTDTIFGALSQQIVRSYIPADDAGSDVLQLDATVQEYRRRREVVMGALGPRLELYLQNYGRQMLFSYWNLDMASLGIFVREAVLRLGLFKFLLVSHPDVVAAATDAEAGSAVMDRLAVRLFYSFNRLIEPSPQVSGRLKDVLAAQVPDLRTAAIAMLSI